jgi:hypothetical protein
MLMSVKNFLLKENKPGIQWSLSIKRESRGLVPSFSIVLNQGKNYKRKKNCIWFKPIIL